MSKIKILHLTDFHFSNDKKAVLEQNRLVEALIKSLKAEKNKIDFLFFTGDLVDKGNKLKDFQDADLMLLQKISDVLNIDKTNIFLCAGNHDVNRGQELDDINESISKIKDNDELDNYVLKQEGKSLKASLENFNNFIAFQNIFYLNHIALGDKVDPLFSTHIRDCNGHSISISSINSAWRAIDSKTDSGNLLYPIHLLKEVSGKVKNDESFNIMLLHHPLSDFKYWNAQQMENIIFKDFHVMFSGHTHKKRDTIHVVPEIGMYSCSSAATLSHEKDAKIGYSIVKIDLENFNLEIYNNIYQSDENIFYKADPLLGKIPVSEQKELDNRFREVIRKKFNNELEKANDLFLSYSDNREKGNFLELFTEPIIDEHSKAHIGNSKSVTKKILISDLLVSKENLVLFGKDKSGKTAILFKVLLDCLNEFSLKNTLPIYINCKELIKTETKIDVIKVIRNFYELSTADAEKLSQRYHIKILLDNFNENEIYIIKPLNDYISKYQNASIIATAEETLLNGFSNKTINGACFNNRFIWDIGRTQIRSLTNKWPSLSPESKEAVLEKIHKVFTQLNIPSNYWTVSLFIWIFEKNADATFRNNFQLIELYIDNLLDKESFISNESVYKIDFEDFKIYLSELAYYLVKEKSDENYILTYLELITFTSTYKLKNRKFVIDVEDIVKIIIEKGVLRRTDNKMFTFRLNGVFEYFLAYFMKDNHDFRDEIIKDGHFYLSFGNEFEICAGFDSRNIDFVSKIYEKTVEIFEPVNSQYHLDKIDIHLKLKLEDKLHVDLRLPQILKDSVKQIAVEDQDVIFEQISGENNKISEVQPKKYYETIERNSDNLEKALFILSRVFRNSKFKDLKFEDEIFDFILNSTCILGFQLMDEIEENKFSFINEKTSEEDLMRLLTQFVPIVIQTFFYDAVVQNNLEAILIEKIEFFKRNSKDNQLKLLILYFSLIDLNFRQNAKYIDEIIEILQLGVLKQTSLIKLYIYLATKINGNSSLELKIQKSIKTQELKIDSSKSVGNIEKGISKFGKNTKFNR
ncbi:metallophosphoesterase [uncultured Flavobacterium sp.]|uniref:metallophosphoesterase n=1 Tax=uncultured Flavobacterium sp. TaxID=165435 RepID=UPI002600F4D4|nr:metallophosphoesterase [uncultured Flavobacterium sp.]